MNADDARFQAEKYLSFVPRGGNEVIWWEQFTYDEQGKVLDAIEAIVGEGPELDRAMIALLAYRRTRPDDNGEEW